MNSQPSIDRKNQNRRQPLRTPTFAGSLTEKSDDLI